jgi:methylated-DNA-protein-cysteine methyltransferase-like protein
VVGGCGLERAVDDDRGLPELESFVDRVLWLVRQIPAGSVATYGQIAHLAGATGAARAVGNTLKTHVGPASSVPWQRVINASGGVSFKGDVGRATLQRALLEQEGVVFSRAGVCKLSQVRWEPSRGYWEVDG